jgi:hypothetical protein
MSSSTFRAATACLIAVRRAVLPSASRFSVPRQEGSLVCRVGCATRFASTLVIAVRTDLSMLGVGRWCGRSATSRGCGSSANDFLDAVCGFQGGFVLPDSNHAPASVHEAGFRVGVSTSIVRQLPRPPVPVLLGGRTVLGARVPEAAVNKHGDLRRTELKVRCSTRPRHRGPLKSESQTSTEQLAAQREFDLGVLGLLFAHLRGHDSARSRRTHQTLEMSLAVKCVPGMTNCSGVGRLSPSIQPASAAIW